MNKQHLLVPIHLDALVITKDLYVLGSMADFSRLPYFSGSRDVHPDTAYLSEEILSHPFRSQDLPLKPGIHLHWALPDALTKTMGLPIVRRQSFFNVLGPKTGRETWEKLISASYHWLTPIKKTS